MLYNPNFVHYNPDYSILGPNQKPYWGPHLIVGQLNMRPKLIPIDHGLSLPDRLEVAASDLALGFRVEGLGFRILVFQQ